MGTGNGRRFAATQHRRKWIHLDPGRDGYHLFRGPPGPALRQPPCEHGPLPVRTSSDPSRRRGHLFSGPSNPALGQPPESTRPFASQHVGEQRVDARLWQDPFAAVVDAMAKLPELKPEHCQDRRSKKIETYCQPPWEGASGPPDLILVVSVSGAPYAEDQEATAAPALRGARGIGRRGTSCRRTRNTSASTGPTPRPPQAPEMVSLGVERLKVRFASIGLPRSRNRRRVAEIRSLRMVQAEARAARCQDEIPAHPAALVQ